MNLQKDGLIEYVDPFAGYLKITGIDGEHSTVFASGPKTQGFVNTVLSCRPTHGLNTKFFLEEKLTLQPKNKIKRAIIICHLVYLLSDYVYYLQDFIKENIQVHTVI